MVLEKRRVGKLGAASLVVSLPADWVRLTGLRKGDDVFVYKEGLSLLVTPRERQQRKRTVDVELVDAHGAAIEVFARYVQGFDSIRVVNKTPAGVNAAAELRDLLDAIDSHLLGVQVLEQTRESATLHVFTREHASLPLLFKRLRFVAKSLSTLLSQELRAPTFDSTQIKTLTKSAFKLYFLVLRLVYGASRGSRDLAEARLSFGELLSFALAAKNICGVLDSVTTFVRAADDLNAPFRVDESLVATIESAASLYLRCLNAFLEKERMDFGEVRHKRRDLIRAAESCPAPSGLMESEARVLRDARLLAREFADRAGEIMELAANAEGLSD